MCEDVLTKQVIAEHLEAMYGSPYVVLSLLEWDQLLHPRLLQALRMRLVDSLKQVKKIKEIEELFKKPINEIMEDFFKK